MKNQATLIFFLGLLCSNYCFSQIESDVVGNNIKIVKVSFENLVHMLNTSTATWENEIKALGISNRGMDKGGVRYSSGNTSAGGIYMITKMPDFMEIQWLHAMNNITIMDELQNSIEQNFLGRDGDALVYGVNFEGQNYTIHLYREIYSDLLFIRKQKK